MYVCFNALHIICALYVTEDTIKCIETITMNSGSNDNAYLQLVSSPRESVR